VIKLVRVSPPGMMGTMGGNLSAGSGMMSTMGGGESSSTELAAVLKAQVECGEQLGD
jgi:hypothetical protein